MPARHWLPWAARIKGAFILPETVVDENMLLQLLPHCKPETQSWL